MLICLAKDSFVRTFKDIGYIVNQLSRKDKIYDINGKIFLQRLSRNPKSIEEIVNGLMEIYSGADYDELKNDFTEFAKELEDDGFVVSGMTQDEINARMQALLFTRY